MKRASIFRIAAVGGLALVAIPALAAIPDSGLLNDVTDQFLIRSATWGTRITFYATWIFWVLVTISMVWTFGVMALRKADIGELFAEFVKFTVTTGFFWWLLSNGPAMAMAIINSMRRIGADAGGLPGQLLSPSTPISIGFDIVKKAFSGLSWVHPVDNLAIVLVSGAIVIAMAVVAANVLIALVQAYVVAYAGTFILGFGGSRWTSDMAFGYFKAMLGIGLELMTMTLMIGIATSVVDGFYASLDGSSVYELLLVLCVCCVLALLIDKIPARVAGLAGGGSGASISAGAIVGAAAVAGAAAATAGAALAAGAASGAGGIQALSAAFSKANAAESAGGGASSLMSALGGAGGAANDAAGGGSALAAAMGDTSGGGSGGAGLGGSASSASAAGSDTGAASGPMTSGAGSGGAGAGSMDASSGSSGSSNADAGGESTPAADDGGKGGGSQQAGATQSGAGASGAGKAGSSSKAGAMAAKAGRIAVGTAANLVQGTWDVAKEKALDMKGAAMDRISETTGGKIAAAIKARQAANGGAGQTDDTASFEGDSLSAGTTSAEDEEEIAAFRDGKSQST